MAVCNCDYPEWSIVVFNSRTNRRNVYIHCNGNSGIHVRITHSVPHLCASLTFLPKDATQREINTSLLADIKEGWQYVARSRSLKMLSLVFICIGLSAGLISPLGIFLITERQGLEATSLQFLSGASGIGLLIGGGIAAAVSGKLNQTLTLIVGVLCLAVATIGEVLSSWFWLTLLISFLSFHQFGIYQRHHLHVLGHSD